MRRACPYLLMVPLLLAASSCVGWRAVDQPMPEAVRSHAGDELRIEFQDGSRIEADSVRARGDTIVVWQGVRTSWYPVGSVKTVATRYTNPATYAALGAVGVGAVVGLIFVTKEVADNTCIDLGFGWDRCGRH